jgi:type I restriction enzyme S subunit
VIGDLKPYADYKDSGLPWLGQVPAHWRVVRNGSLFGQRSQTGYADLPILEVSLKTGVQVRSFGGAKRKQVMSDFGKYKRAAKGDLAYNTMRMWQGALGVCPVDGLVSPAYVVARPSPEVVPEYFAALFRTGEYMAEIDAASRGIVKDRNRLYWDQFKQMQAPCPPPDEQAAIVGFLAWANGRLDRAIRAKRKVIALLTEQKQAVVHRVLTGGDCPLGELVRTGDTWFPQLPRGWHALTLRRVITSAIDGPHFSPTYRDTGIPFLSARNVKVDRWSLEDAKFISDKDHAEFSKRVKPEIGDVLFTKGGTTGIARVVDLSFPFQVWVHIAVLKVKPALVDPAYLAACLNSPRCYEQSQLHTRGATNQDLGLGRMKDIVLPVPRDLAVQREIVARLQQELEPLAAEIMSTQREIELLREYRGRLAADVVNGSLDVRAAAAKLPTEVALDPEDAPDEAEFVDEEAAEA